MLQPSNTWDPATPSQSAGSTRQRALERLLSQVAPKSPGRAHGWWHACQAASYSPQTTDRARALFFFAGDGGDPTVHESKKARRPSYHRRGHGSLFHSRDTIFAGIRWHVFLLSGETELVLVPVGRKRTVRTKVRFAACLYDSEGIHNAIKPSRQNRLSVA